jgi:hypothetical protein
LARASRASLAEVLTPVDSQQVEVLGRAALTAALTADGVEVARAERDAGIDMVAFTINPWQMVPIQMKAASGAAFGIDRKYEQVDRLVMVYVWNAQSLGTAEFYAMTWAEAVTLGDGLGWTKTDSWTKGGKYVTTNPSARVRAAVLPYRVVPGRWRDALFAHRQLAVTDIADNSSAKGSQDAVDNREDLRNRA